MLKLDHIFSSHMVFAAGKPILLYGDGNEKVQITFAGRQQEVCAENGRWKAEFPAMEYSGPWEITVSDATDSIVLEDVWVGEVYLMAGQSNMQFKMAETNTERSEYVSDSRLRLFSVDRLGEPEHFSAVDGWQMARADEVQHWSALAYLAGRRTAQRKGVAVGVIACYQGASVIESWLPQGTLDKLGICIPAQKKFKDHTNPEYTAWNQDGSLYEFQLSQIAPFQVSAVVWYQGESDASPAEAKVYEKELAELIRIWREAFQDKNLFFAVVQIADCLSRAGEAWSGVQEAQQNIQHRLCNVKTIISRDICEADDIHPKTKMKLAERIADVLVQTKL